MLKFSKTEDRDWVVEKGPWMIYGTKPFMLRSWEEGGSFDMTSFERVPMWVKLHDLHPYFRSEYMLEMIGSMIGIPICLDAVTASNLKHEFARILVEVSVEEMNRFEAILVSSTGEEFVIPIDFEWAPWSCSHCECFGHMEEFCPKKSRGKKTAAWKGKGV